MRREGQKHLALCRALSGEFEQAVFLLSFCSTEKNPFLVKGEGALYGLFPCISKKRMFLPCRSRNVAPSLVSQDKSDPPYCSSDIIASRQCLMTLGWRWVTLFDEYLCYSVLNHKKKKSACGEGERNLLSLGKSRFIHGITYLVMVHHLLS